MKPCMLTGFQKLHGYSPCTRTLGAPGCDVDLSLHPTDAKCEGTWNECVHYKNANRFAGVLVPGHPVTALIIKHLASKVLVTHFEDAEDEA